MTAQPIPQDPTPADLYRWHLTPLPEVVELDAECGWQQWDLAVRLGDAGRAGA